MSSNVLRANFTIAERAKAAMIRLRAEWPADDPAAVLMIAWALVRPHRGDGFEKPVVNYYPRSCAAEVEPFVQRVSGLDLIFFITEEFYDRFAGKVIDVRADYDFFLRPPQPGER